MPEPSKTSRGGKREGAGRKPDANKLVGVTIMVTQELADEIKRRGGSKWARGALSRALSES